MKNEYLFIPAIILGLTFVACGDMDMKERKAVPKYHTEAEPGLWSDEIDTHVPVVTHVERNVILVRVPLKPSQTPRHYIEAIALLDGSKEIAIQRFRFTLNEARARFTLPDPEKGNYRVVAKCNLHDMWMAPVNPPEEKK